MRLPLHPLWQIKQIVTVDQERHVDQCTSFGGRGSCRDYTAFMGLVLWIAIFIKMIMDLFGYIDNNFSFDEEGNVMWYEPYQCYYPTKQTKLLQIWDEINLPHDKSKQEYGRALHIIGFMVDRECGGLPWGFSGQPAPLPVETHTLVQGCGFPGGFPWV